MKKIMFFALAAAGLFASCSSDDALTSDVQKADELNSEFVPIKVNLGNTVMTTTRGTGTVGSADNTNAWNGEKFNVYMFMKGTLNLADDELNTGTPIYDNEEFTAGTTGADSVLATATNGTKYYPKTGKFDFWAYRLDGANPAAPALNNGQYEAAFTIDGTQDIMVGQANRKGFDATTAERSYSAWSARNGYTPNLEFNHLLTRLAFKVKAGNAETLQDKDGNDINLTVNKIEVFSATDGTLIVAYPYTSAADSIADANRINWTVPTYDNANPANNNPYFLELTDAAGAAYTPVVINATSVTTPQNCGDALLVWPADANGYYFRITLEQDIANPAYVTDPTQPATIKKETTTTSKIVVNKKVDDGTGNLVSTPQAFQVGTTYDVTITVWGLSEITVHATLNKWAKWGDKADEEPINIDPEEYN